MNTRTDITNAATAASVPYTVAEHIEDMEAVGAFFKWSPEGLWQNMLGIDLDAFHAARVRAEEANITTREIWECLEGRELTPATGRPADFIIRDGDRTFAGWRE